MLHAHKTHTNTTHTVTTQTQFVCLDLNKSQLSIQWCCVASLSHPRARVWRYVFCVLAWKTFHFQTCNWFIITFHFNNFLLKIFIEKMFESKYLFMDKNGPVKSSSDLQVPLLLFFVFSHCYDGFCYSHPKLEPFERSIIHAFSLQNTISSPLLTLFKLYRLFAKPFLYSVFLCNLFHFWVENIPARAWTF